MTIRTMSWQESRFTLTMGCFYHIKATAVAYLIFSHVRKARP